jgi:transcriptional regulator with XRE-family HTH domain
VPPVDPALARVLRRLRVEQGRSLESVARDADISYTTLARIEHEQTAPTWLTIRALARALGVTMAELGAAIDASES